ncbi:hypothetical protein HN011_003160, partial [Eciton burchellii]
MPLKQKRRQPSAKVYLEQSKGRDFRCIWEHSAGSNSQHLPESRCHKMGQDQKMS